MGRIFRTILLASMLCACVYAAEGENGQPTETTAPRCAKTLKDFGWENYMVVVGMLVVSIGIGMFFCLFDKSQSSEDFLNGGGSMGTIPLSLSLSSGFITAIEMLGNPAEMYTYGTQFWMTCFNFILIVPITAHLYLPVYMKLRLTSCYEYLELRFSQNARTFGSFLYIAQMMLYSSVAVYAPALALSNVTGLNVYVAVTVIYVVCVFYSSQGGMKAVIITDSFQGACLLGSIFCVLALGTQIQGGFWNVFEDSIHSNRIELFNFDPDPTVRHSFWSVVVGGTIYWVTMFCSNQATIQKYLSTDSLPSAQKALWISSVGLVLVYSFNFGQGMMLYSAYKDCDPEYAGEVTGSDELLPFYVMQALSKFKGVPGFFVAGIFAASLGTVAAALSSLSAVTLKDFIVGAFNISVPDDKGALYAKWISLVYGILSFALVFVVEQLGNVLTIALSFNGMIGGVTLGMFTLGMMVPWANNKGCLAGSIISFFFVMWIGLGAVVSQQEFERHPFSVEGCLCVNNTRPVEPFTETYTFSLYKISYLWYSAIGAILTVVIGTVVSLLTDPTDTNELDHDLLSPPIAKILKRRGDGVKALAITTRVVQSENKVTPVYTNGVDNVALDLTSEKSFRQDPFR